MLFYEQYPKRIPNCLLYLLIVPQINNINVVHIIERTITYHRTIEV